MCVDQVLYVSNNQIYDLVSFREYENNNTILVVKRET